MTEKGRHYAVTDPTTARIDAFTDAAFAFAVTLLVVGAGSGQQVDGVVLSQVVASIPSFAIGFAIIAMFWLAHVGWRKLRGPGDWRSLALTLLLVFVTLVYVVPLRGMAAALAAYISGSDSEPRTSIGTLFTIYGFGFTAMSVIAALLYRDALRNPALDAAQRQSALGQVWIWAILAWTGTLSTLLAIIPTTAFLAPWLYATLPVSIGSFVWWWDWEDSVDDGGGGAGDAAGEAVLAPDDVQPAGDDQRRA